MININEKMVNILERDVDDFIKFAKKYKITHIYKTNIKDYFKIGYLERIKIPSKDLTPIIDIEFGIQYAVHTERVSGEVVYVIERTAFLESSQNFYKLSKRNYDIVVDFNNEMDNLFVKSFFDRAHCTITRFAEIDRIEYLIYEMKRIPKFMTLISKFKKSIAPSKRGKRI